jgi:cbb3-type cytochrome oxidase cytochrome c subunit
MSSGSAVSLSALVIALTVAGAATLQGQMKVDTVAAARGKKVWNSKQCSGCHELGRTQSTGPDLIGVTDRRSAAWLRKWLKDPVEMANEDSTAMALKKQFNSQMPNLKLMNEEVEALINYLAQQTQEHRAGK